MKLYINKVIKHNFFFSLIFFLSLHLLYMNISIFEHYWEEQLYWPQLRTGVTEYWLQQKSFSFSDYMEYGPTNIKDIFLPYIYIEDNRSALFELLSVLFTCYIALPLITILFKKINQKKVFIVIDIIILSIFLLYTFIILIYRPMIGVIPMYILVLIVLFLEYANIKRNLFFYRCHHFYCLYNVKNSKKSFFSLAMACNERRSEKIL